MWIQQVFVACLGVLLGLQQITAVVNSGQKANELLTSNITSTSAINNSNSTDNNNISGVSDSVAESSELNRREAPLGLSTSYGVPLATNSLGILQDSYVPLLQSNIGLPTPIYGVPDAPTNNIIYPAPPPDIPPPIQSIQNVPNLYGPPKDLHAPTISIPPPKYGPPPVFRPQKPSFNIPKPHYGVPPAFGVPKPQYGPPLKPLFSPTKVLKPTYGLPIKVPKPHYGPPKPLYVPSKPLNTYGPPQGYFNGPSQGFFNGPQQGFLNGPQQGFLNGPQQSLFNGPHQGLFNGHKGIFGSPEGFLNGPKPNYGPPKTVYAPSKGVYIPSPATPIQYGPPEPVHHGPPHPGVPAPPTPPDIKYDGWQPIPGLVSRPPSGSYGVPKGQPLGFNDLQFNTDFVPPPSGGGLVSGGQAHGGGGGGGHVHVHGHSHSHGLSGSYKGSGLSDSYGAPLNSVTGSGGVVSVSGDSLRGEGGVSSAIGIGGPAPHGGNGLSVTKSIGYEIVPTGGHGGNSFASNGPYAAAHSYSLDTTPTLSVYDDGFASSIANSFETTLFANTNSFGHDFNAGVGLIPPSGVYGVPPSGKYGTPLLQPPNKFSSGGFNSHRPKHPVVFREPVPSGLLESIGNSVVQKDAQGIIESAHSNSFSGPAYVPPPVPDVSNIKPVREEEPPPPSTLYTLPSKSPISFQSFVHGSSTAGLNGDFSSSLNIHGANAAALTSYTAPLGTVDGSYGLPQTGNGLGLSLASPQISHENIGATNNFEASHAFAATNNYAATASLPNSYGTPYFSGYQNLGYDCSQKSQPVPSLSFGVPAANSYTAALASLNTNIAGAYQGSTSSLNYGAPDLQTAHSQSSGSLSDANSNNIIDEDKAEAEVTGKSLASNFGPESELIKSQSLDLNNIPLQGTLGSYTLQIQSADGSGGVAGIPHDQVLSDGLLKSILNAIEQPQQNTAAILSQPLIHLQQIPPQVPTNFHTTGFQQVISSNEDQQYGNLQDSEAQHSVTKNIVVTPPPLQSTVIVTNPSSQPQQPVTEKSVGDSDLLNLPLIDNNEIALYFSNNAEFENPKDENNDNNQQNRKVRRDSVLNGQQYGSYVSFKTPSSSSVYGNLKSMNGTRDKSDPKT